MKALFQFRKQLFSTNPKKYDFIVVGAGSGGLGGARRASLFGKKVALLENNKIGGTCVNVGCVPKKVMFNLTNYLEQREIFKDFGVQGTDKISLDFNTFKQGRDNYVKRLNGIYHENLKKGGPIDYIQGTAKFIENKVIEVNGEKLTADHIMIASGSTPAKFKFEGADLCMTSDDIFKMEELPKSMVIIGAGYIGVEMAQILHGFGVKVSIVTIDDILLNMDKEIVDVLKHTMTRTGIDFKTYTAFTKIVKQANGQLEVQLKGQESLVADKVLLAIGRPPNLNGLGIENTSIKVERGAIQVDEYQNTSVKGVYAIGDVINKVNLTPVALKNGRIVAERIFHNRPDLKMTFENIPTVIFSHPPVGGIGLTEQKAIEKYGEQNIKVYRSKFIDMFYSLVKEDDRKQRSLFKLICHKESPGVERVVGATGIGRNIDEMMQGIAVAVNMGATKKDFDKTVAIHPSASEEWVLMDPELY